MKPWTTRLGDGLAVGVRSRGGRPEPNLRSFAQALQQHLAMLPVLPESRSMERHRGRMRQDKIHGLVPPRFRFIQVLIFGDLGIGCRNLFLEISMISGCLRVRYPKLMSRCWSYRGQTPWISFQRCRSDMSRPVSQNHTCLRRQAPRDLFSCGVRPPGFCGDKILGLTLPCMSNPYERHVARSTSKVTPSSLFRVVASPQM